MKLNPVIHSVLIGIYSGLIGFFLVSFFFFTGGSEPEDPSLLKLIEPFFLGLAGVSFVSLFIGTSIGEYYYLRMRNSSLLFILPYTLFILVGGLGLVYSGEWQRSTGPGNEGFAGLAALVSLMFIALFTLITFTVISMSVYLFRKIENPKKQLIAHLLFLCFFLALPIIQFFFFYPHKFHRIALIAAQKRDKTLCEEIPKDNPKYYTCLRYVAEAEGDKNYCEREPGSREIQRCYFYMGVALLDISLCEKSGRYQDDCYREIAAKTGNKQFCNLITGVDWPAGKVEGLKNLCIDYIRIGKNFYLNSPKVRDDR